jgi:flagellar basal-body rod protein FlgB
MDALFSKTVNLLSNMLDYRAKRHTVIVSNISNLDTPNFKPSEVSFKAALDRADQLTVTRTDPGHIPLRRNAPDAGRYDIQTSGKNVQVDTEMANLAENHLMYNMTVELLARKFNGIKTVLREAK